MMVEETPSPRRFVVRQRDDPRSHEERHHANQAAIEVARLLLEPERAEPVVGRQIPVANMPGIDFNLKKKKRKNCLK